MERVNTVYLSARSIWNLLVQSCHSLVKLLSALWKWTGQRLKQMDLRFKSIILCSKTKQEFSLPWTLTGPTCAARTRLSAAAKSAWLFSRSTITFTMAMKSRSVSKQGTEWAWDSCPLTLILLTKCLEDPMKWVDQLSERAVTKLQLLWSGLLEPKTPTWNLRSINYTREATYMTRLTRILHAKSLRRSARLLTSSTSRSAITTSSVWLESMTAVSVKFQMK